MDFTKAIREAQANPPGTETLPLDPFAPVSPKEAIARPATGPAAIPGAQAYALTFYSKRFYVGRELTEIDGTGAKVFGDRDESAAYEEVMNLILNGEAVVMNRTQTIIGDGSVVIWLEWAVKKAPKKVPRSERTHYTLEELVSPERITPRSEALDVKDPGGLHDVDAAEDAEYAPPPLPAADRVDFDEDDGSATKAAEEPDW